MAIPRSVLAQAERAEALQQSIMSVENTEAKAPAPTVDQPPQEAAPAAVAQPAQPEQAPAAAPAAPVEDSWEVKYKVLSGKYSAEVPRLAGELREIRAEIARLTEENAKLKTAPPAPVVADSGLTPESVVEKFGEDFAAAVGAVAARIADQRTDTLRNELAPQIKRSTDTAVKVARSEFLRDLASTVPNYQEIDLQDGFTAFLDEVDPMTGRSRRDFFNEADRANNSQRVAQFFKAYAGTKSPAPQQAAVSSVESQIAPSSSRSSGPEPQGKKVWTQREIGAFYAAARQGRYSADDYKRIESDIFAAQRERRIAA